MIGVPEEVADEVATDPADQAFDPVEADPNEVPAETAFADLDRVKEEGQDRPAGEPLPLAEQADPEAETADLLGLGDEAGPVGEASVASEPSASVPEPAVADTSGVATEANTSCPDQIVPPPTSPNLVDPGADPIQVGHSPASSSTAPNKGSIQQGRCSNQVARSKASLVERLRGIPKLALPQFRRGHRRWLLVKKDFLRIRRRKHSLVDSSSFKTC